MDTPNNSGLIVVTLDGCNQPLTGSHVEHNDAAMKADCLYTVAVMAPDGVLVPTSEGNTVPPSDHNHAQLLNLTPSLPIEPETNVPSSIEDLGDNYYHLLLTYLTTGTFPENISESRKNMISRRSRHYQVIDGKLFYGQKHPKKVVTEKEIRQNLMDSIHIIKESGVHLGVLKMHSKLKKEYFWCGMYIDLTKFVRNCSKCMDVDLPAKSLSAKDKINDFQDFSSDEENEYNIPIVRAVTNVWKQVELRLSGPYSDEYIVTIADPTSHWITAKVITSPHLEKQAADFLISTFCQFGFVKFSTEGFSPEMRTSFLEIYKSMFLDVTSSLSCNEATTEHLTNIEEEPIILCPWVVDVAKSLVSLKSTQEDWSNQISKYLFEFRSKNACGVKDSPFKLMFSRDPLTLISDNIKENRGVRYSKRLQMKSQFNTTEPMKSTKKCTKNVAPKKKTCRSKSSKVYSSSGEDSEWHIDDPSTPPPTTQEEVPEVCEARASTVAAVQALLSATKEERSRRGQYQRYSAEIRDEMASYALEHGSLEAVKYFNEKLGISISESTIRNFAKNYQTYSPDIQEQIGCFAVSHSIEETIQHFANQLGCELRPYIVRKFKKRYSLKYPPPVEKTQETDANKKQTVFEANLRDEIGQYASQYGVAKAIAHFSDKLHIPVKETSVRKFKKCFQEKQTNEITQTQTITCQSENIHNEPMDVSFNVVNCGPATSQTLVFNQQPYQSLISPISFHQNPNLLEPISYNQQNNPTLVFSQATFQSPTTYTTSTFSGDSTQILTTANEQQHNNQMILSQHPILITHQTQNDNNMTVHLDNLTTTFETHEQSPSTINFLHPSNISYSDIQPHDSNNFTLIDNNQTSQVIRVITVETDPAKIDQQQQIQPPIETNPLKPIRTSSVIVSKPAKISPLKKKVTQRIKGRGNYTTYSPEIRAEIGKYAASHGNSKAILHFRPIVGHDIPESTVRGLKEKYLTKSSNLKSKKNITSLGFAPRGRPMRLGKYDEIVRKCITDLVSSGERVSSFLAIATAKQVLTEHEPSLLEENGGNIKLTANWAKSFLKRIGVHNNS